MTFCPWRASTQPPRQPSPTASREDSFVETQILGLESSWAIKDLTARHTGRVLHDLLIDSQVLPLRGKTIPPQGRTFFGTERFPKAFLLYFFPCLHFFPNDLPPSVIFFFFFFLQLTQDPLASLLGSGECVASFDQES